LPTSCGSWRRAGEAIERPEIRQDKVSNNWIIYAPTGTQRPSSYKHEGPETEALPDHELSCPFCKGNEDQLPDILMELQNPSTTEWQTRVIPNKFPALTQEGDTQRHFEGIYLTMPGHGVHEVIIETPHHNRQPSRMSLEEVGTMIETYHRRYIDLLYRHQSMMALIFCNHGPKAGTSLIHPHSQLVVTSAVPHDVRWREQTEQLYFDDWGRYVMCDVLEHELLIRDRVIFENESFVTFVPFAAEVPFQSWIVPKRHEADFGDISDPEKEDFAAALRDILRRLREKLNDPTYNYLINTAARHTASEPHLHGYLHIQPRLTNSAGFEMGSGMRINPSLPEEDAAYLGSTS
jgi:UDPglucose--hexose-1-phosphate uridylyltransferase